MLKKKNLLFLGDSVTAGVFSDVIEDRKRDSYAVQIEKVFSEAGLLKSSHNFAVSGFKTVDMLKMINEDYTFNETVAFHITPSYPYRRGITQGRKDSIELLKNDLHLKEVIKKSDIIIFTIGGNDIVYSDLFTSPLKLLGDKYIADLSEIISTNIAEICSLINNINSNCQIFILGMYIPNRTILADNLLQKPLDDHDKKISKMINSSFSNVTYVELMEDFIENKSLFLNNLLDIHPSLSGHTYICKKIIEAYSDLKDK